MVNTESVKVPMERIQYRCLVAPNLNDVIRIFGKKDVYR